jgi:hypothetical protein
MEHQYEKHENCRAEGHCMICDGGLSVCTVCQCIEGSLATECPGFSAWKNYGERIYKGEIDFVGGEWVTPNRSSPDPASSAHKD